MATFHINRGGTNLGTFSEDEVRDGLRSGKFFGTDLGWREGMATWEPLAQISEFAQEAGPGGAASPQPQFTGASTITPMATIAPRSGLPWDDRQQNGILRAFIDTLIMVLTDQRSIRRYEARRRLRRTAHVCSRRRQRGSDCVIPFSLLFIRWNVSRTSEIAFGAHGRYGNRLDRVHYPCSARRRSSALFIGAGIVHLLLDDCRRSEPTV